MQDIGSAANTYSITSRKNFMDCLLKNNSWNCAKATHGKEF